MNLNLTLTKPKNTPEIWIHITNSIVIWMDRHHTQLDYRRDHAGRKIVTKNGRLRNLMRKTNNSHIHDMFISICVPLFTSVIVYSFITSQQLNF